MSRIGYKVIKVPAGVTVTKDGDNITVKGPKGELTRHFARKSNYIRKATKLISPVPMIPTRPSIVRCVPT